MKPLAFLRNRWVLAMLGLSALALVIWFLGPLFGFADSRPLESVTSRVITILVVVLVWLTVTLVRQIRSQKKSSDIVADLARAEASDGAGRSEEEGAELRARFEEAIATLKRTRGRKGRINLYELPWYVIIGPPGTGKTTAIQNSGLYFPLQREGAGDAIRGIGGTRNCDWWFTDQAILLDTAGRYVTQDSDASADRREWFSFLDLLKKYRKRRPVNGVLLAVSVADVLLLSAAEREAHVAAIRQRLQELYDRCGVRVPVYVMLTKCDLLAGFVEFFGDLSREEREQVWGFTMPIVDVGEQESLTAREEEFELLMDRLNEQVLAKVHQERDPQRRAAIYEFPAQVANVRAVIAGFLRESLRGSSYQTEPFVRGIYLTSGTQEGSPIDRLMGAVSRNFGINTAALPAFHGSARSYFVGRLLNDVVFQEAELAGTNPRLERRRAWLQTGFYVGAGLFVLAVLAGWTVSYFNNQALVRDTAGQVSAIEASLADLDRSADLMTDVVPLLTALRRLPGGYEDRVSEKGTPFSMGLGLYQGDKMGEQAGLSYRRLLVEQFLPRLMLQLEAQLRGRTEHAEIHYEALKRYLMLDSEEHYDAEAIIAWFRLSAGDFARAYSQQASDEYVAHVEALFALRPEPLPIPLDAELIGRVRSELQRTGADERAYGRLRYADTGDIPGFSVAEAAGPDAPLVFVRTSGAKLSERLPAIFTPAGYQQVFLPQSASIAATLRDERWVLGSDSAIDENLVDQVRERYFDDFVATFEALLNDLRLAPFGDPDQAARILRALTREPSPITLLIDGLNEATDLERTPGSLAALEAQDEKVKAAQDELSGIVGRTAGGRAAQRMMQRLGRVEERFGRLRALSSDENGQSPIAPLLALLRDLYEFMSLVASEQDQGGVPPHVAQQGEATIRNLKLEAEQQDTLLRGLLTSAADQSSGIAFGGLNAYLNNEWNGRPGRFCRDAIAGRYPVDRASEQHIQLQDFAEFFGPGGIMDTFFETYLKPYVDTSTRPWRLRGNRDGGVRLDAGTVRQFERASVIREVFFGASRLPSVQFDLVPVSMDTSLTQFALFLDGQETSYSFGPKLSENFLWPGPDSTGEVRVQMTPPGSSGRSLVSLRGPWAWFRLLDESGIRATERPEHYRVDFQLDGRVVTYELVAHSAYNPFLMDELNQFRCPTQM